jgi:hypothetical protein
MFGMGPVMLARVPVGGGGAAVTWNPADFNANLTLSGGNLIATRGAGSSSNWFSGRATLSRNTGKRVFINTNTTPTANLDGLMTGLMTAADALTTFPGQNADSYGLHTINGRCYNNNSQVGADIGVINMGDAEMFAVDFGAGKIWVGRFSSGTVTWDGNPGAGTGQRFTFTAGTALYPAVGQYRQPQVSTANFTPSTVLTLPSGFTDW